MPPSGDSSPPAREEPDAPGQTLAVWAESLYLLNLLLVPGIPFAVLVWLYFKHRADAPPLAVCHLRQTIDGSLWAAMLLGVVTAIVVAISDFDSEATWVVIITYFVCFHSTLVMLGIIGIAKAMAGQKFVYPLIGTRCD
jgi:hypothetical protein